MRDRTAPLPLAPVARALEARKASAFLVIGDPEPQAVADALHNEVAVLRVQEKALRVRVRLLDDELQRGGAMQRSLLPAALPTLRGAEIHALYRPAGALSGDLYDVVRLDERRIAISLADATGHGVAAAILAAFVKRSLCGREAITDHAPHRNLGDVFARLNRQVLDAQLAECQFVAALHAVYDESTRVIRWVRGGAPYPVLVRRHSPPRPLRSEGALLGIDADANFEIGELQLQPGDTLILYTDGLEEPLLREDDRLGYENLHRSEWFRGLWGGSIPEHLSNLEGKLDGMASGEHQRDDVTVIALHIHGEHGETAQPSDPPTLQHACLDRSRSEPQALVYTERRS
ncbi:MAG: serine/threonine-protein phosphatase [Planctomycetes bacterium]|nr:serine/threonine-protein phosphatase [Planctomycetota bacterium]